MAVIHELDSHMADLIAAGEVVERPSSVCKELIENAIDAGATQITVELENGGISYLRICDNGCGMSPEDAPIAFRRHATSKIRTKEDLNAIGTLGFRGEALAAICAVSRVDLFTKQKGSLEGTHLSLEGGKIMVNEPAGCPDGTTFLIRDLFYNTPARMKFLKKDFTEAGYVLSVVEHAAESHPEIQFRCIRDGKDVFHSPGGGKLKNAVFSVFGREMSKTLIEVPEFSMNGITVWGFVSKPHTPRGNRSYQHFFVNGRFIKSKLIQAAMEEAYRNSIITGKYPYGCLCIRLPLSQVDVNVHPAKTEVKFSQEKQVFSAVYAACKSALAGDDNVPELQAKTEPKTAMPKAFDKTEQPSRPTEPTAVVQRTISQKRFTASPQTSARSEKNECLHSAPAYCVDVPEEKPKRSGFLPFIDVDEQDEQVLEFPVNRKTSTISRPTTPQAPVSVTEQEEFKQPEIFLEPEIALEPQIELQTKVSEPTEQTESAPLSEVYEQTEDGTALVIPNSHPARVVGSCFETYILAEDKDGLILIDKHAAHERILFNQLRKNAEIPTQLLLQPVIVDLSPEEFAAFTEGMEQIRSLGFAAEPFGQHSVAVREAPAYLDAGDLSMTISEMVQKLMDQRVPTPDRLDDLIHTVSCKAAIKAGSETSMTELQQLCDHVLSDPEVTCCPHGRPVTVRLTKYELDKMFKRVNQ